MVRGYRITQTQYASTAFDGEGARKYGGRWNSTGTRIVYVSSSLSLATLELLVHTEDIATIYDNYCVIPVDFKERFLEIALPDSLPPGWDNLEPLPEAQIMGDTWAASCSSLVLQVPSAVTPGEVNFLINPLHPDFAKLSIGKPMKFQPDKRLFHQE